MHTYIIAYDVDTMVDKPKTHSQVYADLHTVINSFSVRGQLTESCWCIHSNESARDVRDKLMKQCRDCDRVLVVKSAKEAAWHKLITDNKWVADNI